MKRILVLCLALTATIALAQDQGAARGESIAKPNVPKGKAAITISLNGTPVKFDDVQPQAVAGRMMVPLRGIFEAMGAYVEYDPENRQITARKDLDDIELRVGEKLVHKDGAEILLDVAPLLMKGHVMVPLRFLAETFGGKVAFDDKTNHIDITTEEKATPPDFQF